LRAQCRIRIAEAAAACTDFGLGYRTCLWAQELDKGRLVLNAGEKKEKECVGVILQAAYTNPYSKWRSRLRAEPRYAEIAGGERGREDGDGGKEYDTVVTKG